METGTTAWSSRPARVAARFTIASSGEETMGRSFAGLACFCLLVLPPRHVRAQVPPKVKATGAAATSEGPNLHETMDFIVGFLRANASVRTGNDSSRVVSARGDECSLQWMGTRADNADRGNYEFWVTLHLSRLDPRSLSLVGDHGLIVQPTSRSDSIAVRWHRDSGNRKGTYAVFAVTFAITGGHEQAERLRHALSRALELCGAQAPPF
jgi:hypothetical protein